MNRALLQQALDALQVATTPLARERQEVLRCIEALRAELAKPDPEPVAYWFPKAEQFCVADPRGRPFAKVFEPLYASPVEPNCKFPTCHSQEYQAKLVEEIEKEMK